MKQLLFFVILLFGIISATDVYAHKAKVLDDYKIDVGWEHEPPIKGQKNAIELIITLASEYDKQRFEQIFGVEHDGSSNEPNESDITGLNDQLEVEVKIGDDKSFVTLIEDKDFPGVYYGDYTPKQTGSVQVHVYGTIKNIQFEATFNPEKVEEGERKPDQSYTIPDWIRNNAQWWSEGNIDDSDFVSGLQFLIKQGIMKVPQTESTTTSNEIPSWIKNNAGWWANGQISDDDFVKGIQFLIQNGIINV